MCTFSQTITRSRGPSMHCKQKNKNYFFLTFLVPVRKIITYITERNDRNVWEILCRTVRNTQNESMI